MCVNNFLTKSRLGLNQTPTVENIFFPPSIFIDRYHLFDIVIAGM